MVEDGKMALGIFQQCRFLLPFDRSVQGQVKGKNYDFFIYWLRIPTDE